MGHCGPTAKGVEGVTDWMVLCFVLACHYIVTLPLPFGSLSPFVFAATFIGYPHSCCFSLVMEAVSINLLDYTASHPRRPYSLCLEPWEP